MSGNRRDEDLVRLSLAGNRGAFGEIVARYQGLVASVAYSASGSISLSEDVAQETFLTAWRQLPQLREVSRLAAWLCGIARNLAHNALRSDGREPARGAESIDVAFDAHATDAAPAEQAISAEEQSILWRSLARIPETYREPLVLFYREQHSIEAVATALELSEDAVKQRLSRGRKLLQEQVQVFVEGALERSAPGAAFTLAVLAALPSLSASTAATAAGLASAAGKGGAIGKGFSLAAALVAFFGPIVGFAGSYFGVRASLDAARTERERALVVHQARYFGIGSVLYSIVLVGFILLVQRADTASMWIVPLGLALPLAFAAWLTLMIRRATHAARQLRAQERLAAPERFAKLDARALRAHVEYRSRITLLGLPLINVRHDVPALDAGPARGWIAVGDQASGVLFALGGIASGAIAVGGVAVGLVAVGGVAIGPLAMGGVALGALSLGGAALGLLAVGGYALGWTGAVGGLAIAHDYAGGGLAIAQHANDAVASRALSAMLPEPLVPLLLIALVLLSFVPSAWYAWDARRKLRELQ